VLRQAAAWLEANAHLGIEASEWAIFIERLLVCGSMDAAFWAADGSLIIVDSKYCKDPNSAKIQTWALQLSVYAAALEAEYHARVSRLVAVVLHETHGGFKKITLKRQDTKVAAILAARGEALRATANAAPAVPVARARPSPQFVRPCASGTPPRIAYADPFAESSGNVRLVRGRLYCEANATSEGSTRPCPFAEELGLPCRHVAAVQQMLLGGSREQPLVRVRAALLCCSVCARESSCTSVLERACT
jgi:hypothetical protein